MTVPGETMKMQEATSRGESSICVSESLPHKQYAWKVLELPRSQQPPSGCTSATPDVPRGKDLCPWGANLFPTLPLPMAHLPSLTSVSSSGKKRGNPRLAAGQGPSQVIPIGTSSWADQTGLWIRRGRNRTYVNI